MSCSVCLESSSELFKDKLCDCQFCYWCALNWIEERINQKQNIESFPCLNYKCKQIIPLDHFFQAIKSQKVEQKYQEIMFKNYLQQTADIRPCPNAKCNSYAFLPKNRCSKEFNCQSCNFQWVEKQYLSYSSLFFLKLKDLKCDMFSTVFEFICTQNCPRCDSKILKNGGCSHMTCKKCTFYYCWRCNNELQDHHEKFCGIRCLTYALLVIYNLITTFYFLDWIKYLSIIVYPFLAVGILALYNSYWVLPLTLSLTIYYTIQQKSKFTPIRYKRFLKEQLIFLTIQLVLALILIFTTYFDTFSVTLSYFLQFQKYQWMIVGIIGSVAAVVYGFNNYVYKNWLKFLI